MLIGIDASRALRARRTGTENYSLQLIRHLLAEEGGHRYRLYGDRPFPEDLFLVPGRRQRSTPDVRVLRWPRLWTHMRLAAEVTLHPPDLLFVPSHVLPLLHPRQSVVTIHDLGFRHFPEAHPRWARRYLDLSTRFNAHSAAHLLADSQATKRDLVAAYGVSPERISVVHLGRDEALGPVTDQARLADRLSRLGLWGGDEPLPYVLYVGTLQPRKNLERLVEAFARVLGSHSQELYGLRLVLAGGRGWLAEGIFHRVSALGLEGRVLFPGFVPDEDLPPLLTGALAFAFPSLHEGFGLPILEAQACGVPVLAARASSLPEVAGEGALFADPLDVGAMAAALHRLLTDSELRQQLRLAGLANIQRFSWARCARETLAVLEGCASEARQQ